MAAVFVIARNNEDIFELYYIFVYTELGLISWCVYPSANVYKINERSARLAYKLLGHNMDYVLVDRSVSCRSKPEQKDLSTCTPVDGTVFEKTTGTSP